jgi:hypothetical protein
MMKRSIFGQTIGNGPSTLIPHIIAQIIHGKINHPNIPIAPQRLKHPTTNPSPQIIAPNIKLLKHGLPAHQLTYNIPTINSNPILPQVQHFEMLTQHDGVEQTLNGLFGAEGVLLET